MDRLTKALQDIAEYYHPMFMEHREKDDKLISQKSVGDFRFVKITVLAEFDYES